MAELGHFAGAGLGGTYRHGAHVGGSQAELNVPGKQSGAGGACNGQ